MDQKLETICENLVEAVGQLGSRFGIGRIVGQLYALLFMSAVPLSLDDIMDRLKTSKGNVSINIRELERWGAVKKVWVKGSRKDFYEANPDTLQIIFNCIKAGTLSRLNEFQPEIDKIEAALKKTGGEFKGKDGKTAGIYLDRLGKIRQAYTTVLTAVEKIPNNLLANLQKYMKLLG